MHMWAKRQEHWPCICGQDTHTHTTTVVQVMSIRLNLPPLLKTKRETIVLVLIIELNRLYSQFARIHGRLFFFVGTFAPSYHHYLISSMMPEAT
jgi:hypothetical protein